MQQLPSRNVELTAEHLPRVDSRIAVPTYDRTALRRGIVHIGVGGFHRAHQAVYLDDLCATGLTDWSIVGAGVLPGDRAMADALLPQGGLYTLIVRGSEATQVRVIGSLVDYVLAAPDIRPLVGALCDPSTRIVSLTITEGGYPVDERSGAFLRPTDRQLPPAFEAIVRALEIRREQGLGGFTVMSCDNIMHNGVTAKAATLGVAASIDAELASWIDRNVTFPNTMVDRITPATAAADTAYLETEYGLLDRWPVVAEPFTQWVIEDAFAAGRPPWEEVGALFTGNVEPYEILKLRLLNAGHSCLAYLAALVGHVYVHDVIADELFLTFLTRFLDDEASPALPPVPGIDVTQYKAQLVERFANPGVRDQVARLCLDGTSKFPKFLIPTIEAQLGGGRPVELSALALAGWCQYLTGKDEQGRTIDLAYDPNLAAAKEHAHASIAEPHLFLGFIDVFGSIVASSDRFESAFVRALTSIRSAGVHSTLKRSLNEVSDAQPGA